MGNVHSGLRQGEPAFQHNTGSILLGTIAFMVVLGIVTVGVVSMQGTSTQVPVQANYEERAYQLAETGYRYAFATWTKNYDHEEVEALEDQGPIGGPDNGKFEIIDVDYNEKEEDNILFKVNGQQTVEKRGELRIKEVNATNLPELNGAFQIAGTDNKTYKLRYLEYMGNDEQGVLKNIIKLQSDDNDWSFDVSDETNGTTLKHFIIESKGTYPGSGANSVSKTLTYWWPVSDASGEDTPKCASDACGDEYRNIAGNQVFSNENICATQDVNISGTPTITNGNICAGRDTKISGNPNIANGTICSGRDIKISGNPTITNGNISAEKNTEISGNPTISDGDICVGGDLTVRGSIEITNGDICVDGDITTKGSSVSISANNIFVGGEIDKSGHPDLPESINAGGAHNCTCSFNCIGTNIPKYIPPIQN